MIFQITSRVFLQPFSGELEDPVSEFSFTVLAKSSNPEEGADDRDNIHSFSVSFRVETDFRISGTSRSAQAEFNISVPSLDKYDFFEQIGDFVEHVYDVKNKGPSSISEAEVYILWSSYNDYGEHLLYLL